MLLLLLVMMVDGQAFATCLLFGFQPELTTPLMAGLQRILGVAARQCSGGPSADAEPPAERDATRALGTLSEGALVTVLPLSGLRRSESCEGGGF